jgi:hypothetical protein
MCTATPYDVSDVFFRVDASVDSNLNGFGYEKLTSRVMTDMKIPYINVSYMNKIRQLPNG